MAAQRYEYKVVYVDFRGRVSAEGEETLIQDGERMTAFGRRYLNGLGVQGWELVAAQPQPMGAAFHIFKRPLAEGQNPEPAKPIKSETTPLSAATCIMREAGSDFAACLLHLIAIHPQLIQTV